MAAVAESTSRAGLIEPPAWSRALLPRLIEAQRGRWALWLAPLVVSGILGYFALPAEPPAWLGAAALAACIAAWAGLRGAWPLAPMLVAAAAVAAGFSAAQLRAAGTGTPIIDGRLGPVPVQGRIVEIAPLPGEGGRVLLEELSIKRLTTPEEMPKRVRIRIAAPMEGLAPGDRITVLAELLAPPPPAAPGAFDYQRQAWFERIGAVGFAYGAVREHVPGPPASGWSDFWAELRHSVTQRILAALPEPEGSIAAALMTGHQGAIPNDIIEAMRDSGLAHLLSISGLHIGLIAAILLFGLRAGIALVPWLALRIPAKKVAAVAALIATAAYVLLAGATVPTQRAFLMTAIVMLAVLTDRSPFTMRLVASAAGAVALVRPEAVLGASFQMSFAAVTALIAAHESLASRLPAPHGIAARLARTIAGIALTSLVAGAATAPFAAYHFHRLADYGVLANMIAVPITGFWVMPLAVLAFALMPFGLEASALAPMGWGIDAIIWVAKWVAALPGAAIAVPAISAAALALFVLGGLWLSLWRGRWRWLGLALWPLAAVLTALHPPPDLLISADGAVVAIRDRAGALRLSDTRKGGIAVETWLERNGQEVRLSWPIPEQGGGCDGEGCRAEVKGRRIVLALAPAAAAEECGRADLVISARFLNRGRCRGTLLIDRGALWRAGPHALWLTEEGVRVQTVRASRGERPWVADRNRPPSFLPEFLPWPVSSGGKGR